MALEIGSDSIYAGCMQFSEQDLKRMNQVLRHRLRNVASGVKSAISYLSQEMNDRLTKEEQEYFPLILNECDSITELTSRLNLLFDAWPAGAPMSVQDVLERIFSEMRERFPMTPLRIDADQGVMENRLAQEGHLSIPLRETIVNAIEAAPGEEVSIFCSPDPDGLSVQVEDKGPGVESTKLDEIFRPFYTTRTRQMGIGLSIARRGLDLAGGKLGSSLGDSGGLSITMCVPVVRGSP